jgi:hypothetical protein
VTDAHCTRRITVLVDHPRSRGRNQSQWQPHRNVRDFLATHPSADLSIWRKRWDAIVRKTGRTPQNILTSAKRLGLSIKGRNEIRYFPPLLRTRSGPPAS